MHQKILAAVIASLLIAIPGYHGHTLADNSQALGKARKRSKSCAIFLAGVTLTFGVGASLNSLLRADPRDDLHYFTPALPTFEEIVLREDVPTETSKLGMLGIPSSFHSYYDLQRGSFNYTPSQVFDLAVENGEQQVEAIQLNLPELKGTSIDILKDWIEVLHEDRTLKLIIATQVKASFAQRASTLVADPQIRERISIIDTNEYQHQSPGPYSYWSQDYAKALTDGSVLISDPIYIPGGSFSGNKAASVASAEALGRSFHITRFLFEGGNIVVGEHHVFVGMKLVRKNMDLLRLSFEDVLNALSLEFGKPVVTLEPPTSAYPLSFHIDLSLAVIKDRKLNKEVILLRSPNAAKKLGRVISSHRDSDIDKQEEMASFAQAKLESLGYRVIRVPGFRFVNALNAVFINGRVIAPLSSNHRVNEATEKIYEELGYETVWMKSGSELFKSCGGTRCASFSFSTTTSQ